MEGGTAGGRGHALRHEGPSEASAGEVELLVSRLPSTNQPCGVSRPGTRSWRRVAPKGEERPQWGLGRLEGHRGKGGSTSGVFTLESRQQVSIPMVLCVLRTYLLFPSEQGFVKTNFATVECVLKLRSR